MTAPDNDRLGYKIGWRPRLTWCAHLFKACVKQHHLEMRPLLERLIVRDAVVLDVGSHAGQFAKLFARLAPEGRVIAVEPGRYALSILTRAVAFNRLKNITILSLALGDKAERLALQMPVKPSGSFGFGLSHFGRAAVDERAARREVGETVETTTIDGLMSQEGLARLDFIKMDIEGWELRALTGAAASLAQHRPTIMVEVDNQHLARAEDSAQDLFEYLTGVGYRAFRPQPGYTGLVPETEPGNGDIFFIDPARAASMKITV